LSFDMAAPQLAESGWSGAVSLALRLVLVVALLMPPDFAKIDMVWWPALETIDLGIFGTLGGIMMALPLAILAAQM
jgi:ABC-type phosphate/phosphonate transport system permease subunit